jgi:hypothetical protein
MILVFTAIFVFYAILFWNARKFNELSKKKTEGERKVIRFSLSTH